MASSKRAAGEELTVSEAAKMLGVCRQRVPQMVAQGQLTPSRHARGKSGSKTPLFHRKDVEALVLHRRTKKAAGEVYAPHMDPKARTNLTLRLYDLFRKGASVEDCIRATNLTDADVRKHHRAFLTRLGDELFSPIDPKASQAEHDAFERSLDAENLAKRKSDEQRHVRALDRIRGG